MQANPTGSELSKEDLEMTVNISSLTGLPWWFTNECKQQLLNVTTTLDTTCCVHERPESTTPDVIHQLTPELLYSRIKNQLEYYFSR